jgi:hypothetical protein
MKFKIVKEPSVVIGLNHQTVNLRINSVSRFAYPTLERAYVNYHHRKVRQIRILRGQLYKAEIASKLTLEQRLLSLNNSLHSLSF